MCDENTGMICFIEHIGYFIFIIAVFCGGINTMLQAYTVIDIFKLIIFLLAGRNKLVVFPFFFSTVTAVSAAACQGDDGSGKNK
jgi:hypothetical protein